MPKTLVIRACAVGDFVLNLPALVALHQRKPDTTFTLVGNPSNLDLAREFIPIDKVHSIDLQPWSRLFYEPVADLQFDDALVWMKDPVVADHLVASGIPKVMRADPFPKFGHAADHLLRTLGLARPDLPDLWNPTSPSVFIHAGSGSSKKNWPFFHDLIEALPAARAIPTNLSLVELSHLLLTSRAFIGNDSGITHLAAYLGCPTVALFGPTDPRIWGPIGRRSRIIWKNRLEDISTDDVKKVSNLILDQPHGRQLSPYR
jgi:ADP-heptose:LPS heptosyltransferase